MPFGRSDSGAPRPDGATSALIQRSKALSLKVKLDMWRRLKWARRAAGGGDGVPHGGGGGLPLACASADAPRRRPPVPLMMLELRPFICYNYD